MKIKWLFNYLYNVVYQKLIRKRATGICDDTYYIIQARE